MVRIHSGAPYVGDLSRRLRERFFYTEKEDVGMDIRSAPLVEADKGVLVHGFQVSFTKHHPEPNVDCSDSAFGR